jgi:hypothetical protein
MSEKLSRRGFVGRSLGLSAGALTGLSMEHQALFGQIGARQEKQEGSQEPVKGLQMGKLGGRDVSRLIIGGNLISGSAHAGDLLYQSALMTRYFTSEKIWETWKLAEENGINTTLMRCDPHIIEHYTRYMKQMGGGLNWIAQSAPEQGDPVENARMARDNGAMGIYFHGGRADSAVQNGEVDKIGEYVEGMKKTGILGGVGAHKLETIKATVDAGIDPDFYMYTVNNVGYHSSNPDEIDSYMSRLGKPWIGFKVLGAGRDRPKEGFTQAFRRGADFIAVGMFDWQVRDDVAMVKEMLDGKIPRNRPWCA